MSPVNSVRTDHQPVERSATCSSDGQRIVVGARVEGSMFIASRGSARGSGWAGLAVAHGVVEAGTVLSVEGTEWAVWRNGVGPPIGLARMRGAEVAVMGVPLQGWDVVPLRGAFVAHATDRDVYVVTNVESDRDSHAVLLDVALGPLGARRPVVSWFLGEGTAEAIIQGSDPVLLMHQPSADGHALSVVTVHPQALGRAPLPADVSSVRGATLPTTAIERSATVTLAGEAMQVAPHGVSATLTFMVGTGPARVSDDCQTRARCPGAGRVSLVTFGPGAAPVVREIDSRAWIEDLAARQGSSFDALTVGANPRGEPLATHSLRSFSAHEPAQQPTMLRGVGTVGALSLRCGQDLWGVFVSGTADGASNIGALPLACLSGR